MDGRQLEAMAGRMLGGCEINVCGLCGCNGEAKQAQSNLNVYAKQVLASGGK